MLCLTLSPYHCCTNIKSSSLSYLTPPRYQPIPSIHYYSLWCYIPLRQHYSYNPSHLRLQGNHPGHLIVRIIMFIWLSDPPLRSGRQRIFCLTPMQSNKQAVTHLSYHFHFLPIYIYIYLYLYLYLYNKQTVTHLSYHSQFLPIYIAVIRVGYELNAV